jgi:hypothetical protein
MSSIEHCQFAPAITPACQIEMLIDPNVDFMSAPYWMQIRSASAMASMTISTSRKTYSSLSTSISIFSSPMDLPTFASGIGQTFDESRSVTFFHRARTSRFPTMVMSSSSSRSRQMLPIS